MGNCVMSLIFLEENHIALRMFLCLQFDHFIVVRNCQLINCLLLLDCGLADLRLVKVNAKQSFHDFLESYSMILPSLVKEEELQMSN